MQNCPHCETILRSIDDTFCPECRNALDEPPSLPISPKEQQRKRDEGKHAIWIVMGAMTTIAGVVFVAMGDIAGLIGIIGGLIILAEGARRARQKS